MEERELPVGWEVATISELATKVGSGATPKGGQSAYQASGIPLIRSMNIVFFGFKKEGLAYINEDQAQLLSNAEVRQGDVLLNITGASIGRVTSAPSWSEGARVNQHVCIIRPSECLIQDYLSAYLSSPAIQSFILDENYGVTRQALTKQQVLALEVPVPPLNEQRRIAAKLDTTLTAVDACRRRLDGVSDLIKRFRQAVLAAATSGELTREWRVERKMTDSWRTTSLSDVADSRLGKMLDQGKNVGQLTPYLRNVNVRWFSFDLEDIQHIKLGDKEVIELDVRFGDLLVCEGGEPGRCAVWRGESSKYTFQKALHRVRTSKHLNADYLSFCLCSSANNGSLEQLFTGTTIKHLTGSSLKKFQVPLPSRVEQEEIVDRVETLFTLADQLEARLNAARKVVDRLTPALLAKAFRGELVPQDPGDEPASVLLARIRAARQAEAAAGKPSRRGRKQAAAHPDPAPRDAAPVPPDLLAGLLRECGALSERALLAASELAPEHFQRQLATEMDAGGIREDLEDGERVLVVAG